MTTETQTTAPAIWHSILTILGRTLVVSDIVLSRAMEYILTTISKFVANMDYSLESVVLVDIRGDLSDLHPKLQENTFT